MYKYCPTCTSTCTVYTGTGTVPVYAHTVCSSTSSLQGDLIRVLVLPYSTRFGVAERIYCFVKTMFFTMSDSSYSCYTPTVLLLYNILSN